MARQKTKGVDEAQASLATAAVNASEKAQELLEKAMEDPTNKSLQAEAEEAMKIAERAIKAAKAITEPENSQSQVIGFTEKQIMKARENTEKARRAAYQKKIDEQMKDTIRCKVMNLEDPGKGVSIEFSYEGHSFAFADGGEYDIPKIVVKHLNNAKTPITKMVQNPNSPKDTPDVIKQTVGFNHRFSVVPINMELQ